MPKYAMAGFPIIGVVFLLLALFKPVVFLIWMALFVLLLIWLLPKLVRGLRAIWQRIQGLRAPGKEPGSGLAASFKGPPDRPSSGAQQPRPGP